MNNPVVEIRSEQHYVAIKRQVRMHEIPIVLPPLIPALLQWAAENKVPQSGPVFFRYLSLRGEMMEVEVGIPVVEVTTTNDIYKPGVFPEGKYAVYTYQGDYAFMKEAHMYLENWTRENGFEENKFEGSEGPCWSGRTEFYITDPEETPDPADWITDIVFLLKA